MLIVASAIPTWEFSGNLVPLASWCSLIVAVYLMMIAAMVLVRRQWVEHERLVFPLIQLPLDIAEED